MPYTTLLGQLTTQEQVNSVMHYHFFNVIKLVTKQVMEKKIPDLRKYMLQYLGIKSHGTCILPKVPNRVRE